MIFWVCLQWGWDAAPTSLNRALSSFQIIMWNCQSVWLSPGCCWKAMYRAAGYSSFFSRKNQKWLLKVFYNFTSPSFWSHDSSSRNLVDDWGMIEKDTNKPVAKIKIFKGLPKDTMKNIFVSFSSLYWKLKVATLSQLLYPRHNLVIFFIFQKCFYFWMGYCFLFLLCKLWNLAQTICRRMSSSMIICCHATKSLDDFLQLICLSFLFSSL